MSKVYIEYPDMVPLLKLFMKEPDNIACGNLHIFLEDGNIEDDHIKFCLSKSIEERDLLGEAICRLSLKMSHTQRQKMYREIDKFRQF